MARVGVTVGQYALYDYYADSAGFQSYVEWFRDKMRTALNSAAGTDYKVSDIFKWAGLNANYSGWAFLVEFRAAGVPKNEQVLFVFCGFSVTNSVQHVLGNSNSTTVGQHLSHAGHDTSLFGAINQTVIGLVPEGGRRRSGLTVTTSDCFRLAKRYGTPQTQSAVSFALSVALGLTLGRLSTRKAPNGLRLTRSQTLQRD